LGFYDNLGIASIARTQGFAGNSAGNFDFPNKSSMFVNFGRILILQVIAEVGQFIIAKSCERGQKHGAAGWS